MPSRGRANQRQVNMRLDDETLQLIDECRFEMRGPDGNLPTRSDVVRKAIEEFLKGRGKNPPKPD